MVFPNFKNIKEGTKIKVVDKILSSITDKEMAGKIVTVIPYDRDFNKEMIGKLCNGVSVFCKLNDLKRWVHYRDIDEIL
jgi:F0F1-type ATP synthase alpha subunit